MQELSKEQLQQRLLEMEYYMFLFFYNFEIYSGY